MLEVLRQYAEEKLGENPPEWEETHDRHCGYCAAFLHDRESRLKGAGQKEALEDIADEIENVRAAWQWAVAHGKAQNIDQSQESLYLFYSMRNWFQEGIETCGKAVEKLRSMRDDRGDLAQEQSLVLGRLLARQGYLCDRVCQFDQAKELLQESLTIFLRLEIRSETALPLRGLARVALDMEEYAEARQLYQESLVIYKENGDLWGVGRCLDSLGFIALCLEELYEAKRLLQEGAAISKKIGDQWGTAWCLADLGFTTLLLKEYREARQLLQESRATCERIGDWQGVATSLGYLALVAVGMQEYHEARQIYQKSIATWQEVGYQQGIAYTLVDLGFFLYMREEYAEARQCLQEALETALNAQLVPTVMRALAGMVTLLTKEGRKSEACNLIDHILHHPAIHGKVTDSTQQLFSSADISLLVYARHTPAIYAEFMSGVQEVKHRVEQMLYESA